MTGLRKKTSRSRTLALSALAAITCLAATGCAEGFLEIPIETPLRPKLDVTPFQRVLIAGFIAGGSEDVDGNQETVRLLRTQLRSKSSLRVIDADAIPLVDIARDQAKSASSDATERVASTSGPTQIGRAHV